MENKEQNAKALAEQFKNNGNEQYKAGNYDEAVDFYTQAIGPNFLPCPSCEHLIDR